MSINNILEYASKYYNFDIKNIESVNSGTNKVYKIKKGGQNFYLRISGCGFDYDYVSGEVHWLEYLKKEIQVPAPVISINGKSIEIFQDDGEIYIICMFHELPGVYWNKNDSSIWNNRTFFNWGKTMGHMHRLSKSYQPPTELHKRPCFEERLSPLSNYVAVPTLYEKMAHIQNEISALPKDTNSYGLIHSDIHQQNFLINENDISVLDFDSCGYGFYAHDVAVSLYHAIWWGLPDDIDNKSGFALEIIRNFMLGYNTENLLSDFWLEKIILFMQYRQIEAFSWHIGVYPSKNFTAVVYNELFGIFFDFGQYIKDIENNVFFEGCTIDENVFLNAKGEA